MPNPYVLQRIMQSFWKIHLSVTEKSNRKQNHINVRLYNYSITTCSQSYNDNVKIWCSKWPPFSRIQYYSPMKSGVSADSSSATILRFCEHSEPGHCLVETWRKVQILNEWLAKDVAAIACSGNTNHLSSQPINNKKAQLMLAYPRDAKTMKKIPPFRSYNEFQSSRKSCVYSN